MKPAEMRTHVLTINDLKTETVSAWGMEFEVVGLTGQQRADVQLAAVGEDGENINPYRLGVAAIIAGARSPETHELVFQASDFEPLLQKSAEEIEQLGGVVLRLSGMGRTSAEDARKNSSEPSAASTSGSPKRSGKR